MQMPSTLLIMLFIHSSTPLSFLTWNEYYMWLSVSCHPWLQWSISDEECRFAETRRALLLADIMSSCLIFEQRL